MEIDGSTLEGEELRFGGASTVRRKSAGLPAGGGHAMAGNENRRRVPGHGLADLLGAPELVLLKSAPLPPGIDRSGAARLGLVDPAFPVASRDLARVGYLNLRDPSATARPL